MSMGSGAAEGLQQVLQRLFLEAQQKQQMQMHSERLSEDARQADMQNALGNRNAEATEGLRRATLDQTISNQNAIREDADLNRGVQEQAQLRGNLQMMPKGTPIDNPDMIVGMAKQGLGGMLKPVQNEPRFEFGGTQQAENAAGSVDARIASLEERVRHNQATEDNAATRTGWGPQPLTIQTIDPSGNAVTKVVPRNEATGQTYDAAPTTDTRNRKAASGRAGAVLSAISELSERINVNKGVAAKAIGAVERKKAEVNLSDDVSEYEAVVSGFTPLLARAVGHTGVLTEQDVQSVRKMLPAPGDSKSVRDRKIARITSLMGDLSGSQSTDKSQTQETKEQRMQRLLQQSKE